MVGSDHNQTRRNVLQKMTTAAAVGGLGASATGLSAAESDQPDWEIRNVEWLDVTTSEYADYFNRDNWGSTLRDRIVRDGYEALPSGVSAARMVTTSREVNALNPVQVFLPFTRQVSANNETDGVIVGTVAGESGDRRLISAFGSVIDREEGVSADSPQADAKLYGNISREEEPQAGVFETRSAAQVAANAEGIQTDGLACDACKLVVANICGYVSGKVTNSVCLKTGVVCAGVGGGVNIPAGLGCMGACYLVVGTIASYGCLKAPGFICGKISQVNC